MKGTKRYISRNWIWIVIGLILTEVSAKLAYTERGYMAFGGEWLTLPLVLMVIGMARSVVHALKYLIGMEDDGDESRD